MAMIPNFVCSTQTSLPEQAVSYPSNCLFDISIWMSNWHLKLNMLKTKLIFSTKPALCAVDGNFILPVAYNKKPRDILFFNRKKKIVIHVLIIQFQQLSTITNLVLSISLPTILQLISKQIPNTNYHPVV